MNLLIHQAALGDFVITFSILRAWNEPTAVVSHWSKAQLAQRMFPHVRPWDVELFEFSRLHAAKGPAALSPAVRELFEQSNLIVSFVSSGTDAWAANVKRLAPAARLAFVEPRPPTAWKDHVCAWHQHELSRQGIQWPAQPVERIALRGAKGGPIVIHPGSGGREKCWPVQRFEALMEALMTEGQCVQAILGEVEAERWPGEAVTRWRQRYGATVLLSPAQLYETLAEAAMFIGNDAGPTHLAAQMGLRTIALFGPSDPRCWAPPGPQVTVLSPASPREMDWLAVERVVEAVKSPS
jgi:ADP-heptose:LPS heptosyltransferase